MHSRISAVLVFGYILTNVIKSLMNHLPIPYVATIGVLIMPYALFLMNYVSTFKIIQKNTTSTESGLADVISANNQHTSITLEKILSHKVSLNLFMVHLSNELSIESLFAFIEFTQFQKCVLSKMNPVRRQSHVKLIQLAQTVPVSELITNNETSNVTVEHDMKLIA
eukprot:180323_1